jgi:hypothetical protein
MVNFKIALNLIVSKSIDSNADVVYVSQKDHRSVSKTEKSQKSLVESGAELIMMAPQSSWFSTRYKFHGE